MVEPLQRKKEPVYLSRIRTGFFCLFALLWSAGLCCATSEPYCADFLALTDSKPGQLEFIGCETIDERGSQALQALYRVRGAEADQVESYFVQKTGISPLSFVCCLWESVPGTGRRYGTLLHTLWPGADDVPAEFIITMDSEETLRSNRKEWLLIPWFYIQVTTFLGAP